MSVPLKRALLRLGFGCALLGVSCVAACAREQDQPIYPNLGGDKFPNVGLYTPGNTLGLMQSNGNDPTLDAGTDAAMIADVTGDRCLGQAVTDEDAGASGEPEGILIVDLTTEILRPPPVKYAPKNVGAIWIEDAAGTYIKTIDWWAKDRRSSLYEWNIRACTTMWPKQEPDAVTSATLTNHSKVHHVAWTGKDFRGNTVPDGTYELLVEVAESEAGGPLVKFEFQKSRVPMMIDEPTSAPYKSLKLSYQPTAAQ